MKRISEIIKISILLYFFLTSCALGARDSYANKFLETAKAAALGEENGCKLKGRLIEDELEMIKSRDLRVLKYSTKRKGGILIHSYILKIDGKNKFMSAEVTALKGDCVFFGFSIIVQ